MKTLSWRARTFLKRGGGAFAIGVAALIGSYEIMGGDKDAKSEGTTFHDMRVLDPAEFSHLIDMEAPAVRELAQRLGSPEAAYRYVRDRISYSPSLPLAQPTETLQAGAGSCLSKVALLASLYRLLGMGHEEVRVVTGQAYWQNQIIEHAWLEVDYRGRCLQQDPTSLFETFEFDRFPGTAYTKKYIRREFFCFNDKGFAVVSLNNRFRGGIDPHLSAVVAP